MTVLSVIVLYEVFSPNQALCSSFAARPRQIDQGHKTESLLRRLVTSKQTTDSGLLVLTH